VTPDTTTEVLREWERQRGDDFRAHFQSAYTYLTSTIRELEADQWRIVGLSFAGAGMRFSEGMEAFMDPRHSWAHSLHRPIGRWSVGGNDG
jgi:hypothetical protein